MRSVGATGRFSLAVLSSLVGSFSLVSDISPGSRFSYGVEGVVKKVVESEPWEAKRMDRISFLSH